LVGIHTLANGKCRAITAFRKLKLVAAVLQNSEGSREVVVSAYAGDKPVYREVSFMHGLNTDARRAAVARVSDLVGLIRSEYNEMPGLCLTRAQVQRLWLLEPAACDVVLRTLTDAGFLRLTSGGYVRG
jgi:hypothetical protein